MEETLTIDRIPKYIQTFTEDLGGGVKLTMVLIPPGQFLMGSPTTEEDHQDNESPQHPVTISQPFFMGQYPVTQAQWQKVAGMPPIKQKLEPHPSHFQGSDLPVESISWQEAQEFCARLSIYTKHRYQLPSEAEWEYACRAGTETPFHFGETLVPELANYQHNQTTPVRSFGVANNFGLYDMHGNVWEWCADDWHNSYKKAPTDGYAWVDPQSEGSSTKMLRGGSWLSNPNSCRSAYRLWNDIDGLDNDMGFRVVYAPARTL